MESDKTIKIDRLKNNWKIVIQKTLQNFLYLTHFWLICCHHLLRCIHWVALGTTAALRIVPFWNYIMAGHIPIHLCSLGALAPSSFSPFGLNPVLIISLRLLMLDSHCFPVLIIHLLGIHFILIFIFSLFSIFFFNIFDFLAGT